MIRIVIGDPEDQTTEAVLRPVTSTFAGTSAPSRRLEDRAGDAVTLRLHQMGDVPAGAALITPAGDLPFSFLIHAVVRSEEEPLSQPIVRKALLNGLRRAHEWDVRSLTLLPLGVGAGNLDAEAAAQLTADVLGEHLPTVDTLEEIVIAVDSDYLAEAFRSCLAQSIGEDGVGTV
jgi:O-acetyl-ADP-ribose deacetylase (regulator of RNase III)